VWIKLNPRSILVALTLTTVIGLLLNPVSVFCQAISAQINDTYRDVRKAEASGATAHEMSTLADQLNQVIRIQDQLRNVPLGSDRSRQLTLEINKTLVNADTEARQITGSNRAITNFLVRSSSAALSALLVTIAFHWCTILRRSYRIKRTFQMKIIPKSRS
jgi:hypothetical protein